MKIRRFFFLVVLLVVPRPVLCGVAGCGDDEGSETSSLATGDASVDRHIATPSPGPILDGAKGPLAPDAITPSSEQVDASCKVTVNTEVLAPALHVPEDTVINYATNPPSSGSHYPRWANFQEFDHPIQDGYLVHSMEHGAVVLFYKCASKELCPAVAAQLMTVRDQAPTDPLCDPTTRLRVIVVPRPDLDVPVAAAAWGYTYKAECVDAPTLASFITAHEGQGPENFCAPGATF